MGYIKGYTFETKELADETMISLNNFFNLPVPGGTTYFSDTSYELIGDVYFMHHHEMLESVLGVPIEISINI